MPRIRTNNKREPCIQLYVALGVMAHSILQELLAYLKTASGRFILYLLVVRKLAAREKEPQQG